VSPRAVIPEENRYLAEGDTAVSIWQLFGSDWSYVFDPAPMGARFDRRAAVTASAASWLAVVLLCLGASHGGCTRRGSGRGSAGSVEEVVFTEYSPLSRAEEIARRTLTPLTFRRGQEVMAARGKQLSGQQIDLANERFAVFVPDVAPPIAGYGLLVFVSPAPQAVHPNRWRPPLARHRLIFVSAANSGNEASILDRRLPLALLAYENVRSRHPIDPKRVYVGGLSGGSRVAEMAALGYPDVFRAALLNAGSDPIGGEEGIYLPPADLLRKFQETRVVYVTGAEDEDNLAADERSQKSLRDYCVFDIDSLTPGALGHQALDASSLDRALDLLDERSPTDPAKLAQCNSRLQAELDAQLSDASATIERGDRDGARARLKAIDARYGGLAAPRIFDLDAKLKARR
jgi:pimeloyl-ACP methyl ester carboxylesterase